MTDSAAGAAAPPKKRFAFKKAAWQTAPKAEEKAEVDLFSHSNEFKDIVADQTKRKLERKKQAEEARKKQAEEEAASKRRKLSEESSERIPSESLSPSRERRLSSKGRRSTPRSPVQNKPTDTLSARYDSLTKSSNSRSITRSQSNVITLDDSDDDCAIVYKATPTSAIRSFIPCSTNTVPDEELKEVEDPEVAALRAAARERAAKRKAAEEAAAKEARPTANVACVQLLISSHLPDTKPIIMKVRTDQTIETPRVKWCERQGFTPAQTNELFLTYRDQKVFDSTTIEVLGIKVDDLGNVSVPGDTTIYDETNLPKIHLYAWTPSFKAQFDREEAEEAEAQRKAAQFPSLFEEPPPEPTPEPESNFRVKLVEKGQKEGGLVMTVHPTTSFGHLASAYKQRRGIPEDQPITLIWDGDRLSPLDTIADSELENLDTIEVHLK